MGAELPPVVVGRASAQGGLLSTAQLADVGISRGRPRTWVRHGLVTVAARGVLDVGPVAAERGSVPGVDPDRRRRRSAWLGLLAAGPDAIAVGPCALALLGVAGLPEAVRPEVALPGGRRTAGPAGVTVRYLQPFPTVTVGGRLVAAPAAALAQAVPLLDRRHGVAVLDSAANRRMVSSAEEVRVLVVGRRGARRVQGWWRLVDGRAESPLETDARLQCLDAGLPPDDLQVRIRGGSGGVIARGDLGFRLADGRWLLVEVDGRGPHDTPDALYRDRSRQNALAGTGRVELLRFTAADLADGTLVREVAVFLARRGRGRGRLTA